MVPLCSIYNPGRMHYLVALPVEVKLYHMNQRKRFGANFVQDGQEILVSEILASKIFRTY